MIKHIFVKNIALIDELSLDLPPGFTSLTGETGAGKSILLGAISLALGKRADTSLLSSPEQKSLVEITVELPAGLKTFFEENDLDYATETLLRREITPSGKSRAFINDTPVRLDQLQQLAERLVNIHSQHDTLLLNDSGFQLELIDLLASNAPQRDFYVAAFAEWGRAKSHLQQLLAPDDDGHDPDYLAFLLEELQNSNLQKGESEQVEEELSRLGNAEEMKELLAEALTHLETEESGALDLLRKCVHNLERMARLDSRWENLAQRIQSAQIELEDIANECDGRLPDLESDPERLAEVEARTAQLENLLRKHKLQTADELLELQAELAARVEKFQNREAEIAKAEKILAEKEAALAEAALNLSTSRKAVLPQMEEKITTLLKDLNLDQAAFSIKLENTDGFKKWGTDEVAFMFSANAGQPPKPLGKIASGGELGRVMLALKAILSRSKALPTIIFDEIDTGVSGQAAGKIARILSGMGAHMQVVAITHLPQIASAARQHLYVEKHTQNGSTKTHIRPLQPAEREREIARLLSGEAISEAALANARDLLKAATP